MNAIMIMCHKNLDQVERLINRCLSIETRIFLHIDKKFYVDENRLLSFIEKFKGRVFLANERISGCIDDRSLVDITMLMIKKAKNVEIEENIHFNYYLLLSGQDYLVKDINCINDELARNYPKPFIDCIGYYKGGWIEKKFSRNPLTQRINKFLRRKYSTRKTIIWAGLKFLEISLRKFINLLHMSDFYYFARKKVNLYGGSAWWVLPDKAIDYILLNFNTKVSNRLLWTETPEEVFFQTMVMRSSIKDLVELSVKGSTYQNCKTWSYFSDIDKAPVNHPYTFTANEYEKLINKGCWFARKFDLDVDVEIFELLDKRLERDIK